jgi:hypothetical protein
LVKISNLFEQCPSGEDIVKKFPAFYGTRKFIAAFTTAWDFSIS